MTDEIGEGQGSVLDLDFSDVYVPKTHPDGTETRLRVVKGSLGLSKAGNQQIVAILEDPADDHIEDIYHYLAIPTASHTAKEVNRLKGNIEKFYQCFSVDYVHGSVDVERDLQGAEGDVILKEEDDPQYGPKNSIKKFIVPK